MIKTDVIDLGWVYLLPLHFLMHSVNEELYSVEHASEVFKITLVIYTKHWSVNTEAESTPLREEEKVQMCRVLNF